MARRQALIGTEAIEDNCSTFAGTTAWFQPSTAFNRADFCTARSSSTAKRWYILAPGKPRRTPRVERNPGSAL